MNKWRVCRNCNGDLYAVGNDPDRCTCPPKEKEKESMTITERIEAELDTWRRDGGGYDSGIRAGLMIALEIIDEGEEEE